MLTLPMFYKHGPLIIIGQLGREIGQIEFGLIRVHTIQSYERVLKCQSTY